MYLAMLLAVPVLLGLLSLAFSKGRITLKEFLAMELAVAAVLGIGYAVARHSSTSDREIWNGRITSKEQVTVSCDHSYSCNCYESCSSDGKGGTSCTETCQTCYEHSNDYDWNLNTSSNEIITIDRVDRQGVNTPPRWNQAYVGEPIVTQHRYKNYILANPDSILRRTGAQDRFKNLIPPYPMDVYDYYRLNRFMAVGYTEPRAREWNWLLNEINGDLGPTKQVNILVLAVKHADPSYEYALAEAWIGGKKNDVVVLLGVPEYPKISWARIVSWSTSADLKVDLRDQLLQIGSMDRRDDLAAAIRTNVQTKFRRRHMKDFEYLMAGMQPSTRGTIILFVLGLAVCGGLLVYFYQNDPFGDEYSPRGRHGYYSSTVGSEIRQRLRRLLGGPPRGGRGKLTRFTNF
jgi:hypothetical protein